jgi:hypothetical protein
MKKLRYGMNFLRYGMKKVRYGILGKMFGYNFFQKILIPNEAE